MMQQRHNVLLIGAALKDSGKTTLCERLIHRFAQTETIIGVKITIFHGEKKLSGYSVTEETRASDAHDTTKMRAAGAQQVFWVRCDETTVEAALQELFARLPHKAMVVCESNSARHYLEPALFIMVIREGATELKPSAQEVIALADYVVTVQETTDTLSYHPDIVEAIFIENNSWRCHLHKEN